MRFVAVGRVLPERTATEFTTINLSSSDGGRLDISCDASQLAVVMDLPGVQSSADAKSTAEHFAQAVVSALGFSLGTGYSVEISQVIGPDNSSVVFGVRPGKLGFEPNNPTFEHALRLGVEDLLFRLALRDYVRALSDETDCALYCYRAVEALSSSFANDSDSSGWQAMHAALGTTRDSIQTTIKTHADPIRHGNWTSAQPTTPAIRMAALQLTRDILHKYMTYRRGQGKQ